jgi:hypothetical protein
MGKIQEILITQFNGGISEDKRNGWFGGGSTAFTTNKYAITKHFDAFTYPKKLVPWNKTVTPENYQTQYNIKNFCYAQGRFYGLGDAQSGTASRVNIFQNDGGLATPDSWSTSANGTGTTANKNTDIFFPYKTYIFMYVNGAQIDRFDTAGGAYSSAYQSITASFATQALPVWHKADDCAYFFADNLVHKLNNTSWSASVQQVPSNMRIVACCEHGNYLAIGCVTVDSVNPRSVVFLWDRDTSLATFSDQIDFGEGTLKHLASLDGRLIGVVDFYTESALGLRTGKVYIKDGSGQTARIINELDVNAATTRVGSLANTRFVRDNKLYFPMSVPTVNSDDRFGIWVLDSTGRVTLSVIEPTVAATAIINAIFATGYIWWIAFGTGGAITRTSYNTADFSSTNSSIYETLIFTGGDSAQQKKLLSITVMTEPLPLAGTTVTVKYRKDEETSWTTIYTQTSDANAVKHTAVNIESSGLALPQFREIQFQVSIITGATITGLKAKVELLDSDILT